LASFAYDGAGNRTSLADSLGGLAAFAYDGAGRLAGLTSAAGTLTIDHDLSGRLASVVFPSEASTAVGYDSAGRIGSIQHMDPTSDVLSSFAMSYSPVGNVTGIAEPGRSRTFGYNELERLTSETEPPAAAEFYDYDAVGNRTMSPLSNSHSFDAANRLSQDDDFAYSYDDNGNLETRTAVSGPGMGQVTTYHWNRRNQLTGIDLPPSAGAAAVTYRYDALGRRIEKAVDAAVTRYVYDGDDIVLETDGQGSLLRRYRHGDGIDEPLVLEEASGESFFYHRDHLGSVVMVTDEAGAVAAEYEYDAYGRRDAISEDIEQPYAFTGREWDTESGLYYYRARYYDPGTGRFLSEDPIGFDGGDANLYRYVRANPQNLVDPTGLDAIQINFDWYPVDTGYGFYMPLGHGAVISVDPTTGKTRYYEFGRYRDKKCGNVERRRVPNVVIGKDGLPTEESLNSLYDFVSKHYGKGSNVTATYHRDTNHEDVIRYAEDFERDDSCYSLPGNNCKTFARDAATAACGDEKCR